MKLYGEISKTEELEDGTIKVFGYASSQVEDSDGETITADAMKAALPDYLKFGAVREMHQPKAAGTAIEADVQEDGKTWFGAHVVDSEAVKKVKAGVYKGFSIGGRVTDRDSVNKAVITGLKLIEVSLVDRPANPEAVFTCYKAETIDEPAPATTEVSDIDVIAAMLDKGDVTPARIIELVKADKAAAATVDTTEKAETPADPEDVKTPDQQIEKGMWNVQDFAGALQWLGSICASAEWDKQLEGDNSPVPAQLREWLTQGVEIFKAMAAEELAEMLADLKEQAGEIEIIQMGAKGSPLAGTFKVNLPSHALGCTIYKADKTGTLVPFADVKVSGDSAEITKAGAKFSKATKEALGKVHAAAKECCDHLDKLGYNADDEDDKEKAATGDDLAKVTGDLDLAKAEITKLTDDLAKAQTRIRELEAEPAPGKALLKAIAVGKDGKAEVVGETPAEVPAVKNADGTENTTASLIKAAHAQGGKPLYG